MKYKKLTYPMKVQISIEAGETDVIHLYSKAMMSRKKSVEPLNELFEEVMAVAVRGESKTMDGKLLAVRKPKARVFARITPLHGGPLRSCVDVEFNEPDESEKSIRDLQGAIKRCVYNGMYEDKDGNVQIQKDPFHIVIYGFFLQIGRAVRKFRKGDFKW